MIMRQVVEVVRRRLITLVVLAALIAAGFGVMHWQRSPVHAATPTVPLPPHMVSCRMFDDLIAGTGRRRPWVDADPAAATLVWLPGVWARTCRPAITTLSRDDARTVAKSIRSGTRSLPGISNCGSDDGGRVVVYFTYDGTADAEVVRIALSGCGGVTAPGRGIRSLGDDGTQLLSRHEPTGWPRNA
jgi:hypothetical protein